MTKSIRIGHASLSENRTAYGEAGDQGYYDEYGRHNEEVRIQKYSEKTIKTSNFHTVLRPKDSAVAEKSVIACEQGCNNNCVGYSQNDRLSLYNEAEKVGFDLSKITVNCNTDCSAFMAVCAIAAGVNVSKSVTTTSMVKAFKDSNKYNVITDTSYFSDISKLARGDILVKHGHTIMVLGDEGSSADPSVPGPEVTSTISFSGLKLNANLTKITTSSISLALDIIKIENDEVVDSVDNTEYNWSYLLSPITAKTEPSAVSLSMKSNNITINNGISKDSTYKLIIKATKKSDSTVYTSPNIIFTTKTSFVQSTKTQKFGTGNFNNIKKCNMLINIKDSFKPTILYHKEEL